MQVPGSMSRGSAISAQEIMKLGTLIRKDGKIIPISEAQPAKFDFGTGAVSCLPLSFGDLITAWHSTDIPMFVDATGAAFPEGDVLELPDGPGEDEKASNPAKVLAEVAVSDGFKSYDVMEILNGYSYTPLSAVEAVRQVLDGKFKPGFQTLVTVFGPDFSFTIPHTRLITVITKVEKELNNQNPPC